MERSPRHASRGSHERRPTLPREPAGSRDPRSRSQDAGAGRTATAHRSNVSRKFLRARNHTDKREESARERAAVEVATRTRVTRPPTPTTGTDIVSVQRATSDTRFHDVTRLTRGSRVEARRSSSRHVPRARRPARATCDVRRAPPCAVPRTPPAGARTRTGTLNRTEPRCTEAGGGAGELALAARVVAAGLCPVPSLARSGDRCRPQPSPSALYYSFILRLPWFFPRATRARSH